MLLCGRRVRARKIINGGKKLSFSGNKSPWKYTRFTALHKDVEISLTEAYSKTISNIL